MNSKGLFNEPFNNAKNPTICDKDNLRECSKLLQNVKMSVGDYSTCENFICRQKNKNAMILLSNSDPKNTNTEDNFFDDLYSDFEIKRVLASRMINSDSKNAVQ